MVTGSEIPESTNSLLLRLADVIVTDAPLAFRLPLSDELDPTATLPKPRLAGVTASWPEAVPVPENAMLSGELGAFDTTDRFPLAAPALVGAKVAVNVTLWFAVRVRGKVNPLIENSAPVTFACEMVMVDPPVLLSVSDRFALPPTWILPNARLEGFEVSKAEFTPFPLKLSTILLFTPSSAMVLNETLPLKAPAPLGANVIVAEVAVPAGSVSGRTRLSIKNPAPLVVALVMVTSVPP
jgi:hypothetical protein